MGPQVLASLALRGIPGLGGKFGSRVELAIRERLGSTHDGNQRDVTEAPVMVGQGRDIKSEEWGRILGPDHDVESLVCLFHGIDNAPVKTTLRYIQVVFLNIMFVKTLV